MAQAYHGGRLAEAEARFGRPREAFVDFSSNLNGRAPQMTPELWESWRNRALCYPEADAEAVCGRLAAVYGVPEAWLLPGAGAIEGLYLVARLFAGKRVAVIEPGFSDYARAFEAGNALVERVVLEPETWARPIPEWPVDWTRFDGVVLGNPNNPTGAFQEPAALEEMLERAGTQKWIVDEAFVEFVRHPGQRSLLPVLERFPSLFVVRSLTKSWGVPGLRLGFLAGACGESMERLRALQPPWALNGVAEAWAEHFLTRPHHEALLSGLEVLARDREALCEGLSAVEGIRVYPSACNFLLLELAGLDPEAVEERLGRMGLLVRLCDSFYGMPKGRFLRVAVKTAEENERLVDALAECCAALRKEAR
jgi:threonine-phosphate decarboxylase